MAEWSKAPDSRAVCTLIQRSGWEFWSPIGGVGSNPTSDMLFLHLYVKIRATAPVFDWIINSSRFDNAVARFVQFHREYLQKVQNTLPVQFAYE